MRDSLPILYEDAALIVLDKPAGITVNRSQTTIHEETIQDWTEKRLGFTKSERQDTSVVITDYTSDAYFVQAFRDRGGIVHRLDKETSGILLVAKDPQVFKHLQQQFKDRTVEKTYRALVHGVLTPPEGEIAIPVDRLPWNRRLFGVVPGGRPSTTFYATVAVYTLQPKRSEQFSLVEITPKTGRTHQIRVHMKYLNHPIVSDFLYAGRKTSRDDRKLLDRVFLHAVKIRIIHPVTGEMVTFTSPLAEELQSFITTKLV